MYKFTHVFIFWANWAHKALITSWSGFVCFEYELEIHLWHHYKGWLRCLMDSFRDKFGKIFGSKMKFRIKPKHLGFNRSLLDRTTWFIKKLPQIHKETRHIRTNKVEWAHCEFDLRGGVKSDFRLDHNTDQSAWRMSYWNCYLRNTPTDNYRRASVSRHTREQE